MAEETESLCRQVFNDIALLIGDVAVIHCIDDDLVWVLMKRLDRIRVRLFRALKGVSKYDDFNSCISQSSHEHGAIEEFLVRNYNKAEEWMCPVCKFSMNEAPCAYNICSSCETEFGNHDVNSAIAAIRSEWLKVAPQSTWQKKLNHEAAQCMQEEI